ncbi:cell wall-active antibiotics response protein LiaF [Atopobacter phocae]|uniref:cell wall-active antibiotics response protein LiaF n=1 Tax=Atopobacter phocae TaxID=136492 RepID=UPI00046F7CE8|nr:cell wall-active antibiotics response protein LiaF [Atopobacter phocae]
MFKQKNMFKVFIILEIILFALLGYSICQDSVLFNLVIGGFFLIILGWWRRSRFNKKGINLLIILGVFLIFSASLANIYSWFILVLTATYVFLSFSNLSGRRNKLAQLVSLKTKFPESNRTNFKQKWIGDRILINKRFEWDDMTFNSLAGDMIIDLGHTILPNGDNYIVINKAFGDTKVIVPPGMGVSLKHHSVLSDVQFLEQTDHLRNEIGQYYSFNFDTATKRVKIISNNLFGDFEVIVL